MTNGDPTVVAVYELVGGTAQRVAEFRVAESGKVELTLAEPGGCPLAQEWFEDGIRVPGRSEPVRAADGPDFLRAALRPRQMSFCRVVDESRGAATAPEGSIPASPGSSGRPRPRDRPE
ncbi:hypothetical protein [Nocardia sp. NPDC003963]